MLNTLQRYLVKALLWCFTHRAEVVAAVEAVKGLDVRGERKRSLVLNRLREQLPQVAAKDLALIIELVLQEAK